MNRRKTVALIILSIFIATIFTVLFTKVEAYRPQPLEITDMIEDGMIRFDDPGYTRFNDLEYTEGNEPLYRAYLEFNISSIPSNAIIDKVEIRYMTETPAGNQSIYSMENQPSVSSDNAVYTDCHDGTMYVKVSSQSVETWYTQDLGSSVASDLQTRVDNTDGWFAIGRYGGEEEGEWYSVESANDPILYVYYHFSTDNAYTIDGAYYENGTFYGAVNATAHSSSSVTFEVNGSDTYHFVNDTTAISWDIGSGNTRMIYVPNNGSSLTLFIPEDNYDSYGITIFDYTGKLGEGTTYLESYRTINATEYLIERRIIFDSFNEVPLTLVVGEIYRLQILWSDDTTYDWGYFIAGVDTTPTLVLSKLTFSQKAQMTYKYLSVEATRQNATWIRVNYQDDTPTGYETDWCNITVTLRNGTVITTYNSTSETVSWNWYSADNETDYWVLAEINQTFWTIILEYSKLLDADLSYSAFPNLNILGTLGGLNTANTLSAVIVLCVFGVGSRKNVDVALISGFSVAGMLRIMGANTWSWNLLAFGFALSIAYAVYRGRVRP